jgi:hypothetical protein
MHQGGFRRWTLLGALAATALLGPACNDKPMPRTGSRRYEGVVNSQQPTESFSGGNARQSREPATGGSGTQGGTGTQDKTGAQGSQGGIGAPGSSSPQEQSPNSPPRPSEQNPGTTPKQ